MSSPKAILSIQSEVVAGHVGNAAARFALQRLGHEVWAVPTVLLSSHAGHKGFAGEATSAALLGKLLDALKASDASKDNVPSKAREEALKVLKQFVEQLPPDHKVDMAFAIDREGRVVAQVGYDTANAFPNFELGGYPAVFDALHGYARDDVWSWGGQLLRVATRSVDDEPGQPAAGAVPGRRAAFRAAPVPGPGCCSSTGTSSGRNAGSPWPCSSAAG